MKITGLVLMIIGVLFIILSLAGAAVDLAVEMERNATVSPTTVGGYTELFRAVGDLFAQLLTAPRWVLSFVAGIILLVLGNRLYLQQSLTA